MDPELTRAYGFAQTMRVRRMRSNSIGVQALAFGESAHTEAGAIATGSSRLPTVDFRLTFWPVAKKSSQMSIANWQSPITLFLNPGKFCDQGMSLCTLNPQSRQWHISWVNCAEGTVGLPRIGGFKNGRLFFRPLLRALASLTLSTWGSRFRLHAFTCFAGWLKRKPLLSTKLPRAAHSGSGSPLVRSNTQPGDVSQRMTS